MMSKKALSSEIVIAFLFIAESCVGKEQKESFSSLTEVNFVQRVARFLATQKSQYAMQD